MKVAGLGSDSFWWVRPFTESPAVEARAASSANESAAELFPHPLNHVAPTRMVFSSIM